MTDPSTLLEMDLPDSVSNAARDAFDELDGPLLYGYKAAIRAALQAMVDCGRAKVAGARQVIGPDGYVLEAYEIEADAGGNAPGWTPAIIIRLSPQRKDKEQT